MIKTQLTSAIDSVNFNKKNKAEWKGRVNSWLPQQWLGKKGINAYKRIDKKYGNLTGALNNWFNFDKKFLYTTISWLNISANYEKKTYIKYI